MNGLLGYLSAALTFYACISWNDAQLATMVNPEANLSVVSSIADVVVSNDSTIDVNAIASGDFSSAKALITAASNATAFS